MNGGQITILVVDDDDKLISLLELYLKRDGFQVIAARDGAQALDLFKVVGLQAGADDYVSKPFSPQELVARVRTILRRTGRQAGRLARGSLVIDIDRHEVFVEGQEVRLTAIEFKLLRTGMESPGRVFP